MQGFPASLSSWQPCDESPLGNSLLGTKVHKAVKNWIKTAREAQRGRTEQRIKKWEIDVTMEGQCVKSERWSTTQTGGTL